MTSTTHPEDITTATVGEQPEQEALTQRLAAVEAANAQLRATVDTLTQERERFLAHMSQRAYEVATENDWCGVARSLVEELGGAWPIRTFTFTVTATRTVTATLAPGCDRSPEQVTRGFVEDSLQSDYGLELDDDWTDIDLADDLTYTVTHLQAQTDD